MSAYTLIARRRFVLAIAPLVLVGVGGYAIFTSLKPSNPETIPEVRREMIKSIRSTTPEKAYAAFKESVQPLEFNAQHNRAHLFGESLYDVLGTAGIRICDSDLNFGCYHGFVTKAIATEGMDAIPVLDSSCAAACRHGLGHGILEYVGHTNLLDALSICATLDQPDPLAGCTSGVFMEYNVPLIQPPDESMFFEPRVIDEDHPHDPCPTLPEKFQASCYHELPQWWGQLYDHDFAKLADLCAAAPAGVPQESCYKGMGGLVLATSEFNAERVHALCSEISDPHFVSQCFVTASWSATTQAPEQKELPGILCAYAASEDQTRCPQVREGSFPSI